MMMISLSTTKMMTLISSKNVAMSTNGSITQKTEYVWQHSKTATGFSIHITPLFGPLPSAVFFVC